MWWCGEIPQFALLICGATLWLWVELAKYCICHCVYYASYHHNPEILQWGQQRLNEAVVQHMAHDTNYRSLCFWLIFTVNQVRQHIYLHFHFLSSAHILWTILINEQPNYYNAHVQKLCMLRSKALWPTSSWGWLGLVSRARLSLAFSVTESLALWD